MYKFLHFIGTMYLRLFFGLRVYGRAHIQPGAMIVAGNHSSLSDPIYAGIGLPSTERLRFMAKIELFRFPPLRWLIEALGAYPIERGKGDVGALKKTLEMLSAGQKVLIFPDGHRNAEENPDNAKNGAALLACKSGVPVLPMYITPDRRFLRRHVSVWIGESYTVTLPEGPRAEGYRQITQDMMKRIYSLPQAGKEPSDERRKQDAHNL